MKQYELVPEGKKKDQLIKIDFAHKSVKGVFWVVKFQDHQFHVAYLPSLDLSGYGDTEDQAVHMLFTQVLQDYMENLLSLKPEQISAELKRYGWKRDRFRKKRFTDPPFVDKEGVLRNFNLPAETPIKEALVSV